MKCCVSPPDTLLFSSIYFLIIAFFYL